MENNSIREFTCNDCHEVTKVDWSMVRPDIDDGSSNIYIQPDGDTYKYVGECENCGNWVEIEPPVPELVVDNVDVDKDGMYIQVTDKVTNRSCWIEAWKSANNDDWDWDFNQYIFHLDDDNDVIAKMFQEDLGNYVEELGGLVLDAINEHEEEYNKLQENKAPTMRDRLKEAKARKLSFEDWKESDLYIPALLKYYDVDTEEELADCNISENDIVDIYNEYASGSTDDYNYYEIHFDFTEESGKDSDGYSKFFKSKKDVEDDIDEIWNLAIMEDVIGEEDDYYDADYAQKIDKDEYERATRTKVESKEVKTEEDDRFKANVALHSLGIDKTSKLMQDLDLALENNDETKIKRIVKKLKEKLSEDDYKSFIKTYYPEYKDVLGKVDESEEVKTEEDVEHFKEILAWELTEDRLKLMNVDEAHLSEGHKLSIYQSFIKRMNNIKYIEGLIQQYEANEINTLNNTLVDLKHLKNMMLNKKESKKEEAKFKDKVKAIKKSLKKNDKRLSDKSAEKSAEKIAGSMIKKEESKETYEYALEVRDKNTGKFLYQVDCYSTPEEAIKSKKSLKLNNDEEAFITVITYNEDGEEVEATTYDENKKVTETVDEENSLDDIVNYIKGIVDYDVSITPTGKGFSSYDVNFLNTDGSIMYSVMVNDDVIKDKVRLLNTLVLELKRLYTGKTFADSIREDLLNELNKIHPVNKKVTESRTSDMDTVAIIMELEGGELTIADVDDWNKVKEVANSLKGSQGYYGRLLKGMLDTEEEFGGVENLPFPITM